MIDFAYAGMHHSYGSVNFPEMHLEYIRHPSGNMSKFWRKVCVVNDYYSDNGYQEKEHIPVKDLKKFLKHRNPRHGFVSSIVDLPTTLGNYFERNKPTNYSPSSEYFTVQNNLDHVTGIDFGIVAQLAAENVVNLDETYLSFYTQQYRCFTVNVDYDHIRKATREDLRPIAELFKGDNEFGFVSNHIINNHIQDPNCIALVVCDISTKVIGAHLAKIMSNGSIHDAYSKIVQEKRGKGIGRALFNTLIQCGKEIGSKFIYGDCLLNGESKSFYEHLGAVFGEPKENAQKQQLIRFHYTLETEQKAFF